MKPLPETCQQLLNKIGRTRNAAVVTLVGILADALDEAGHPAAKRLRNLWANHQRHEQHASNGDFSKRRRWARAEYIGSWRRDLRRKVGRLFGRRWRCWESNSDYA